MKKILAIILLVLLIPYIIITLFIYEGEITFYGKESKNIRVKKEDGKIISVPLEEYIVGVVSSEMPTEFCLEALKAQAVAARSYAYFQMQKNKEKDYDVVDTVTNQVYQTEESLKEKWQEKYTEKINKVRKAVIETKKEYITYNGKIIEALFFSTSPGKTENVEEVFSETLPYLRSVDSSFEENVSPVFREQKTFVKQDFCIKLTLPHCNQTTVNIKKQTSTGRIKRIEINGKEFTGSEIASLLSLRSNYFQIEEKEGKINITTGGYGHGVGMSQYGAEALARKGYMYDQIIKYYYTGVEIKKIEKNV